MSISGVTADVKGRTPAVTSLIKDGRMCFYPIQSSGAALFYPVQFSIKLPFKASLFSLIASMVCTLF